MQALLFLLLASACGGGGLYTNALPQEEVAVGNVQITHNAFLFGSDYPASIVIPDIAGMRDTAFVVSTENPAGVVAIDLTTSPLQVSQRFKGLTIPAGNGYPRGPLAIADTTRAFCLTSSHVIDFNPTTGAVNTAIQLLQPTTLAAPQPLSRPFDANNDGVQETTIQQWTPTFPGGLAVVGKKLYVSFSNYLQATTPAVAAPGLLRAATITSTPPYLTLLTAAPIVTTRYNPTALRALHDGTLLIVNSGVNDIVDAKTIPRTTAGVDFLDTSIDRIVASVDLGPVALAFQPPVVTDDETLAFLLSASYGEGYAIDLTSRTSLFDSHRPVTITGNVAGEDFLTDAALRHDGELLFVSSFTHSAIYAIDWRTIVPRVLPPEFPEPIVVGFPAGVTPANPSGVNTGIGAMAMRPGIPDRDFTGPDLFAITGMPGTLVAINTRGSDGNPSAAAEDKPVPDEDPPPPPAKPDPAPPPATAPTPPPQPLVVLNAPPPGATAFADTAILMPATGGGFGSINNVIGAPVGGDYAHPNNSSLFSLGCGGAIVLEMTDYWIADGPGPDFIVFENAIGCPDGKKIAFPEPGVVGVSQDGVNFVEFPCTPPQKKEGDCAYTGEEFAGCAGIHPTLSNATNGISATDPSKAGGDAFDLAQVKMPTARFVRIHDVSCTTGTAPNAGFDLDAVSVIHGTVPK